jgi:hypothetical protein
MRLLILQVTDQCQCKDDDGRFLNHCPYLDEDNEENSSSCMLTKQKSFHATSAQFPAYAARRELHEQCPLPKINPTSAK